MRRPRMIAHAIRATPHRVKQRVFGGSVQPSPFADLNGPDLEFLSFVRATLNPAVYLAYYPDVAAAGVDPVEHWITHGLYEDRMLAPGLNVRRGAFFGSPGRDELHRFNWRGETIVITGPLPAALMRQIVAQWVHEPAVLAVGERA